jgi:hypothetical protein
MKNLITVTVIIGILAIVFTPFLFIWSLNTLFPVLNIPYELDTWAAGALIWSILHSGRISK